MLFKLHSNGLQPGVVADPNRFKEVYRSPYGKVRIYKILSVSRESKNYVANPKNRVCDAPGSWYCRGQYPPALKKILDEKKDFEQLEDFNRKKDDNEYQKQYFENLDKPKMDRAEKPNTIKAPSSSKKRDGDREFKIPELSKSEIERAKNTWEDNNELTMMWELIKKDDSYELLEWIQSEPLSAYMRSKDGRGPMFWAHEFGHKKIVKILKGIGVSETDLDSKGLSPLDISKVHKKRR